MFCPGCGKDVGESDAFCRSCGRSLSAAAVQGASGGPPPRPPEEPVRRSGEASASLILGLFSFIPVVGLLAVIFGHMARASIRRSGGRLLGDGMASFGLFFGYLGLLGWIVYGLSVLIHPSLPSTRMAYNEKSAAMSLMTVNVAAITYASTYDHGFPPSLEALGPPRNANPNLPADEYMKLLSAKAAGLVDGVLASGTKSGYRYSYTAGKKDRTGRIVSYTVHADPVTPGVTGEKHFFTDESQVIREEKGKEANAYSAPLGSTGSD